METIVTGTPGNGKTAHVLDMVFFDKSSVWYQLDKYVDGIADLKLEHFDFPDIKTLKAVNYQPLSSVDSDDYACWLPDSPHYAAFVEARATAKTAWDLWFLWASPNSVLIVDEAQRYMRPRPAGSPVPLAIQMIEYHRHFGIHFIFITQKERLLHSNVRMLAGQHIHLTSGWRGRHRFEWPECKDSESKSDKKDSAHNSYSLPKHVFPFYKSTVAVLSTSHKTPLYAYLFFGALLFLPVIGYMIYKTVFHSPLSKTSPSSASSGSLISQVGVSAASGVSPVSSLADAYASQFKPVMPGRPESAPAFDKLREVVVMPRISACLRSASSCICYTQQGSRIADMSEGSCIDYLAQGTHFNPYVVKDSSPSSAVSDSSRRASLASGDGFVGNSNILIVPDDSVPLSRSAGIHPTTSKPGGK